MQLIVKMRSSVERIRRPSKSSTRTSDDDDDDDDDDDHNNNNNNSSSSSSSLGNKLSESSDEPSLCAGRQVNA
jgi:hypothetical protein